MGIFPVTYGAIRLTEAVLGISPVARVDSVVVMTAIATLLDGAALMWFPVIYENSALMKTNSSLAMLLSRRGAAWILWGFGAGLVLSLLLHHHRHQRAFLQLEYQYARFSSLLGFMLSQ